MDLVQGPDSSMPAQLAPGVPLPSPQDLMGRILVKNKKRHRPSTGGPDSAGRKRPLEQSNSFLCPEVHFKTSKETYLKVCR